MSYYIIHIMMLLYDTFLIDTCDGGSVIRCYLDWLFLEQIMYVLHH